MHNALNQVSLELGALHLNGFSVSGLSTYLQFPELDLCFDMGECPLSAVGLNHIFLTHAHGDHSRCLMRHDSLRRMMGVEKPAVYYIPANLEANFRALIKAEAEFEGVSPLKLRYPEIVAVEAGVRYPMAQRKNLSFIGFPVFHNVPTMGYTIYESRNKLKAEFHNFTPAELIATRESGIILTEALHIPKLTFLGDSMGETLWKNDHIWNSEILVMECTFIQENEEQMARHKGHTHLNEICEVLEAFGDQILCKHIVLSHFSMKYSKSFIREKVYSSIPQQFISRVQLLC